MGRSDISHLRASFQQVLDVWWATIKVRLSLYAYSVSYSQIATIFPFVVASPRFFAGAITLGALIQISTAFTNGSAVKNMPSG